jgi:hypothetical protein
MLQNNNFERAGILNEDFLRVDAEVFINVQIYRDSPANFDGFHDSQTGKSADAYFIAGMNTKGFEQYEQRVPAESECPCALRIRKPGECLFVFSSPSVGHFIDSQLSPQQKNPQLTRRKE